MYSIQEIYLVLSKLPHDFGQLDSGLNGRSAVSLFLFEYSDVYTDIIAYNKGIELLEYELNSIEEVKNVSLYNGLTGIAWTINYLSSKNLIEINHDDFLPALLEDQLKNYFFTHNQLISLEHFTFNENIFFYFINRLITTNNDSLRKKYIVFINQGLILFIHYFYQINDLKIKFEMKVLTNFIKTLNLLSDQLKSPLLHLLLTNVLELAVNIENIKHIKEHSHFIKASVFLNNQKFQNKLKKYKFQNKTYRNNFDNTFQMGIWQEGLSYQGLKKIMYKKKLQDKFLEYFIK
ncbi:MULTISPECIES: hypothetical protein [Chryseobacterium]|uniref:Uncharacterized protein n=1 Tax=Chryseobacterium endophyticum TaxID=1854762 RepID=A0AAU6WQC1_9FLAO|nr:hypothetical protein [uncultured Chryseobacterium sp.]